MQIKATIKVVNPVAEGISKTNGNPWKRQEIIIGWYEVYGTEGQTREQLVKVSLHGKNVDIFNERGYAPGMQIEGNLDFATKAAGDKVFNDIVLWVE